LGPHAGPLENLATRFSIFSAKKAPARDRQGSFAYDRLDTTKETGDFDHLKVFATKDAAETWLQENDPEGEAFEYEVVE
jgi:hypothetical protein